MRGYRQQLPNVCRFLTPERCLEEQKRGNCEVLPQLPLEYLLALASIPGVRRVPFARVVPTCRAPRGRASRPVSDPAQIEALRENSPRSLFQLMRYPGRRSPSRVYATSPRFVYPPPGAAAAGMAGAPAVTRPTTSPSSLPAPRPSVTPAGVAGAPMASVAAPRPTQAPPTPRPSTFAPIAPAAPAPTVTPTVAPAPTIAGAGRGLAVVGRPGQFISRQIAELQAREDVKRARSPSPPPPAPAQPIVARQVAQIEQAERARALARERTRGRPRARALASPVAAPVRELSPLREGAESLTRALRTRLAYLRGELQRAGTPAAEEWSDDETEAEAARIENLQRETEEREAAAAAQIEEARDLWEQLPPSRVTLASPTASPRAAVASRPSVATAALQAQQAAARAPSPAQSGVRLPFGFESGVSNLQPGTPQYELAQRLAGDMGRCEEKEYNDVRDDYLRYLGEAKQVGLLPELKDLTPRQICTLIDLVNDWDADAGLFRGDLLVRLSADPEFKQVVDWANVRQTYEQSERMRQYLSQSDACATVDESFYIALLRAIEEGASEQVREGIPAEILADPIKTCQVARAILAQQFEPADDDVRAWAQTLQ